MKILWIGVGSALGGIGRYLMQGAAQQWFGAGFPWGTLAVNILGSAFIGFFATMTAAEGRWLLTATQRQFVMVGICGGFTTFSSFSLETLNLMRDGQWPRAGANVVGSVVCCLVAVWAGHTLAAWVNR